MRPPPGPARRSWSTLRTPRARKEAQACFVRGSVARDTRCQPFLHRFSYRARARISGGEEAAARGSFGPFCMGRGSEGARGLPRVAHLVHCAWKALSRGDGGRRARSFLVRLFLQEVAAKAEAAARAAAIATPYRDAQRGNRAIARSLLVLRNGPRPGCGLRPRVAPCLFPGGAPGMLEGLGSAGRPRARCPRL